VAWFYRGVSFLRINIFTTLQASLLQKLPPALVPKLEDVPKAAKVIKDAKGTVYVDESGKTFG
jgi:hypothetical protein